MVNLPHNAAAAINFAQFRNCPNHIASGILASKASQTESADSTVGSRAPQDLTMQPRPRAAASPRLDEVPDLAADQRQQPQHRDEIDSEERDDHVVGRADESQVGKHQKRRQRRQQRGDDGHGADRPGRKTRYCRRPLGGIDS